MTASATAARRIQRRQTWLTASDCESALRATKFRKTMPPMVSDSKLSVAPRKSTERKPKIWSRRATAGLGLRDVKGDFAARDVAVGSQDLPADAVFAGV